MTNGRADDGRIVLEIIVVFGKTAQRPCNVICNGWFFGNDQLFAHEIWESAKRYMYLALIEVPVCRA